MIRELDTVRVLDWPQKWLVRSLTDTGAYLSAEADGVFGWARLEDLSPWEVADGGDGGRPPGDPPDAVFASVNGGGARDRDGLAVAGERKVMGEVLGNLVSGRLWFVTSKARIAVNELMLERDRLVRENQDLKGKMQLVSHDLKGIMSQCEMSVDTLEDCCE